MIAGVVTTKDVLLSSASIVHDFRLRSLAEAHLGLLALSPALRRAHREAEAAAEPGDPSPVRAAARLQPLQLVA